MQGISQRDSVRNRAARSSTFRTHPHGLQGSDPSRFPKAVHNTVACQTHHGLAPRTDSARCRPRRIRRAGTGSSPARDPARCQFELGHHAPDLPPQPIWVMSILFSPKVPSPAIWAAWRWDHGLRRLSASKLWVAGWSRTGTPGLQEGFELGIDERYQVVRLLIGCRPCRAGGIPAYIAVHDCFSKRQEVDDHGPCPAAGRWAGGALVRRALQPLEEGSSARAKPRWRSAMFWRQN